MNLAGNDIYWVAINQAIFPPAEYVEDVMFM